MNILFRWPEGVVEIHAPIKEDDSLGTVEIGGVEIQYSYADLKDKSLVLHIPFKDLTIYDLASYEEMRNGDRGNTKRVEV